jgi:hypothetical protein
MNALLTSKCVKFIGSAGRTGVSSAFMKLRPTRPRRARPGRLDVIIFVRMVAGNF